MKTQYRTYHHYHHTPHSPISHQPQVLISNTAYLSPKHAISRSFHNSRDMQTQSTNYLDYHAAHPSFYPHSPVYHYHCRYIVLSYITLSQVLIIRTPYGQTTSFKIILHLELHTDTAKEPSSIPHRHTHHSLHTHWTLVIILVTQVVTGTDVHSQGIFSLLYSDRSLDDTAISAKRVRTSTGTISVICKKVNTTVSDTKLSPVLKKEQ